MCVRRWGENAASLVSLRTGARLHQSESLQRNRNREIAQTLHLLLFQMQLFPCHKNVQISEIMRLFFITDEGRWTWEINLGVKTLFARPWPWLQIRQSKVLFVIVIWSHQWAFLISHNFVSFFFVHIYSLVFFLLNIGIWFIAFVFKLGCQ